MTIPPLFTPRRQPRADVLEALHGEQVRRHRDDDMVRGDQRGAVDRSEVRSNIQHRDLGTESLADVGDHPVKRSRHAESTLVAFKTLRPLLGKVVFKLRELEVACHEGDAPADTFVADALDIANTST